MVISCIVILLSLVIAYMWASRGFFSAFLHMLAVIAAGGIAFALWEPIAYMILGSASKRWMIDCAWGVSLAVPFVVLLVVIRVTLDKTVRANVDLDGVANLVGGGVCGVVSATLSLGIAVLSVSALRLPTNMMIGWKPIWYTNQGSLSHENGEGKLWVPVDRITASFYSMLSDSAFRPFNSDETLAKWHPDVEDEGVMLRINYAEGSSNHLIPPDKTAFEVTARYSVGKDEKGFKAEDRKTITADTVDKTVQNVTRPDGEMVGPNSYIEAFVVKFGPKAREKIGNQQVIIGNAQLRLIVEPVSEPGGRTMALHPMAVISKGKPPDPPSPTPPNYKPPPPQFGRWRYNSSETFIASVGGENDAMMAFEFLVPKEYRPIALYVKGIRVELPQGGGNDYKLIADRDKDIKSGKIVTGGAVVDAAKLDTKGMFKYKINLASGDQHIRVANAVPYAVVLQRDSLNGIEIDIRGNSENFIVGGSAEFTTQDLKNTSMGMDRKLQVRKFGASDDTAIVLVTVDKKNTEFGFLSAVAQGMDRSAAPVLIDSAKNVYTPVGFVYKDAQSVKIRFEPGSPITSIDGAPSISSSRPDQEMTLVYRITRGARLQYFAVGNKALAEFLPPLDVTGR